MRLESLKQHIGKVVCLDLVSGVQVVTKLKSVDEVNNEAVCGELRVFNVQVVQRTPNGPPEGVVQNFPYGKPLYDLPKEVRLSVDHIMMVLDTNPDMAGVYVKETSGIVMAGAGALDALKGVDFNKIQ